MVYTHALRACGASHAGSSPASGTIHKKDEKPDAKWQSPEGKSRLRHTMRIKKKELSIKGFSLYFIPNP